MAVLKSAAVDVNAIHIGFTFTNTIGGHLKCLIEIWTNGLVEFDGVFNLRNEKEKKMFLFYINNLSKKN